jgi:hypothetical protein
MKSFVVFISENKENSCSKCKMYNGRIYEENDSRKPRLPIHPNCRCSYRRYSGNLHDRNALISFFKNLPEATQIVLETKYLPSGTGELIGAVKAVSMIYTEKGLWLARARAAVRTSPKARYKMTEILLELEDANSQNDLKKIIRIYNKYK